jgi:predicted dehydrogenase
VGERTKVGVIGCGNISEIYLKNLKAFETVDLVACADMEMARAEAKAAAFGIEAKTVEAMLADPSIQIIVNLTPPLAHAELSLAILNSGKHVYSEKPLATTRADGERVMALAKEKGLRVGCAPDTFLGGGLQTVRQLLDEGAIGEPVAATAFFTGHGPEAWHPNPDFFYQPGGGPMFDLGPYYLTTLVALLGPARRVTGSTRISFPERTVGSGPYKGQTITVRTSTHAAGVIDFESGPMATVITSFDVWSANLPRIEIYGTLGSISVPDPNTFGGPVVVRLAADSTWGEKTVTYGFTANSRGLGVADMAAAIQADRPHRANGEMAFHVLDLMSSFDEASVAGQHINIASRCERPAPLPTGFNAVSQLLA